MAKKSAKKRSVRVGPPTDMTMRDYLASQCLSGLIYHAGPQYGDTPSIVAVVVARAYEIADAMVIASQTPPVKE